MSSHDLGPDEVPGFADGAQPGTGAEVRDGSPADSRAAGVEPADATPAQEIATGEETAAAAEAKPRPRRRVRRGLRRVFLPGGASPRWRRALPWASLAVIVIAIGVGGAYLWTWGGSASFCGTTCHTMPPQYVTYQLADHSRVTCAECHIGRGSIGTQIVRKAPHAQLIFRNAFGIYEYPIYAHSMRPAREACETCHVPEKFSTDSLVVKQHYKPDEGNTPFSISLIMKTGGGTQREGLGQGIHWHVENKVEFVSTDKLDQNIPYVRVTKADGTVNEYVDVEANFDKSKVDSGSLKTMDCISCHNRVSHPFQSPVDSVESSLSRGLISTQIPSIRQEAVKALTTKYDKRERALAGIALELDNFYKTNYPDFYASDSDKVEAAIAEVQRIYSTTVFTDQKVDWTTHPDNLGHNESPGCFRCHDGKHLDAANEAVRLECNLCHSVPVVTATSALVTNIEVTHGPEPSSHTSPNWIGLHNRAFDKSCADCHTTSDAGGISNVSFCSNSACHGTSYAYAGFDAPALRQILKGQAPPSPVSPTPSTTGKPTYGSFVGPLLVTKCGGCHGDSPAGGLKLTTYPGLMAGANDGPVIVKGNGTDSLLVKVQSQEHYANLSAQELAAVKQWIDSGAIEK